MINHITELRPKSEGGLGNTIHITNKNCLTTKGIGFPLLSTHCRVSFGSKESSGMMERDGYILIKV